MTDDINNNNLFTSGYSDVADEGSILDCKLSFGGHQWKISPALNPSNDYLNSGKYLALHCNNFINVVSRPPQKFKSFKRAVSSYYPQKSDC